MSKFWNTPNTLDTSQSWGFIFSTVWLPISWALTTQGATSHTGGGGNMKLMFSVHLRRLKGPGPTEKKRLKFASYVTYVL